MAKLKIYFKHDLGNTTNVNKEVILVLNGEKKASTKMSSAKEIAKANNSNNLNPFLMNGRATLEAGIDFVAKADNSMILIDAFGRPLSKEIPFKMSNNQLINIKIKKTLRVTRFGLTKFSIKTKIV